MVLRLQLYVAMTLATSLLEVLTNWSRNTGLPAPLAPSRQRRQM
jgi:hypothetical protein